MTQHRRVLITGVSGSAGSYLAEYLLENHPTLEVWGTSRKSPYKTLEDSRLRYSSCDLQDFAGVQRMLDECQPEIVFHLASNADVRGSFDRPLDVLHNNIMGTASLLEGLRTRGFNPLFQLCSTSEVYGNVDPKNVPITESCPINPCNPYAVSKLTQDALGYTYYRAYGLPLIRTRAFGYINPRRSDLFATAFAMQIARIEAGQQEKLRHGNLDSIRTLLDVRDIAEAYWQASNLGEVGEVYNIGSTVPVQVGHFLDLLKRHAKTKIVSEPDPKLMRPTDVTNQIPSVDKFVQRTKWQPRYTLDESVQFLLDHCRHAVAGRL